MIQNDTGNKRADTTIVVPLTTREKKKLPTHIFLPSESTGLPRWSVALCEHVQTVSKKILYGRAGELIDENLIVELNHGIAAELVYTCKNIFKTEERNRKNILSEWHIK